jgi:murein L,D-transpeptidase YafK
MKKLTSLILLTVVLMGVAYYFFPEQKLPADKKIDKIIVRKNDRIMEVYSGGEVIKTYTVSLGRNPVGDKQSEGDKRTPEGHYRVISKNPDSQYHKNLGISYPDNNDIAEAEKNNVKPGGEIKIHGIRNGFGFIGKFQRLTDWTAGCIALTDEEVDELYARVEIGTPIIITP